MEMISLHKNICVIPARYESSRLPCKPLADICGRPMIWWVYNEACKVNGLNDVLCAVDDERVMSVCKQFNINAIMTRTDHAKHINRVHEVSEKISADYYIVVCGDEPLIETFAIEEMLKVDNSKNHKYVVNAMMRDFDDPVEAYDTASMKCAVNIDNYLVYVSRSIIPLPYKTVDYKFKRLLGIEGYNKEALDLYASKPTGILEAIEDITLLRYLENFVPVKMINTKAKQIGVDTQKNLNMVRAIIQGQIDRGEKVL